MRDRVLNVTMNSVALFYDQSIISNPDDRFSEFKYFERSGAFNLFSVSSPLELKQQISTIVKQATKEDIGIGLIFEFHGSMKGMHIGDEILPWKELGMLLYQLNICCRNQVYCLFATCFAAQIGVVFQDPSTIFSSTAARAPINFAVFPEEEIYEGEVAEFGHPFIKRWLSVDKSNMDDLLRNIFEDRENRRVSWISCYGQWDTIREKTYAMLDQKILGSQAILNKYLRSQKSELRKKIGRLPKAVDYRERKSELLKIDRYKLLLEQMFNQFFMIDLYPENAEKYQPIMDFSDIEELIARHKK